MLFEIYFEFLTNFARSIDIGYTTTVQCKQSVIELAGMQF